MARSWTYRLLLEVLAEPAGHDVYLGIVDVWVRMAIHRAVTRAEVFGTVQLVRRELECQRLKLTMWAHA
jgi:hypothetical protein